MGRPLVVFGLLLLFSALPASANNFDAWVVGALRAKGCPAEACHQLSASIRHARTIPSLLWLTSVQTWQNGVYNDFQDKLPLDKVGWQ